jgi:hypothetical protein
MSTFISLPPTPGGGAQLKCQRKPFSPPPGAGRGNARNHLQREISAFFPSHSGLSGGAGRPCQRWDFLPPGAKGKGAAEIWQRSCNSPSLSIPTWGGEGERAARECDDNADFFAALPSPSNSKVALEFPAARCYCVNVRRLAAGYWVGCVSKMTTAVTFTPPFQFKSCFRIFGGAACSCQRDFACRRRARMRGRGIPAPPPSAQCFFAQVLWGGAECAIMKP